MGRSRGPPTKLNKLREGIGAEMGRPLDPTGAHALPASAAGFREGRGPLTLTRSSGSWLGRLRSRGSPTGPQSGSPHRAVVHRGPLGGTPFDIRRARDAGWVGWGPWGACWLPGHASGRPWWRSG